MSVGKEKRNFPAVLWNLQALRNFLSLPDMTFRHFCLENWQTIYGLELIIYYSNSNPIFNFMRMPSYMDQCKEHLPSQTLLTPARNRKIPRVFIMALTKCSEEHGSKGVHVLFCQLLGRTGWMSVEWSAWYPQLLRLQKTSDSLRWCRFKN